MNATEHGNASQLKFGPFVLDRQRSAVFQNGTDLGLRPKTFDVLHYLASHPGEVINKDELMSAVWGDTVVTEDSITQCVVEIRRAMGSTHRGLLRTVPRRGYLFDAEVVSAQPHGRASIAVAPPARNWKSAAAVTLLLASLVLALAFVLLPERSPDTAQPDEIVTRPVIAVLPFVDLTRDQNHAWLGDGIAEEILNLLAQSRELVVIARTSSFALRDQGLDIPAIAQRLGADFVLEGSVRDDQQDLRFTAQLVEASTNEWADVRDLTVDSTAFSNRPSLFDALEQQLGLKLEPRMEPLEFLIVDEVRQPTPD
jgi:TolB-like protein/DNA-binding winged helix-turn-helix (wHTH) protein